MMRHKIKEVTKRTCESFVIKILDFQLFRTPPFAFWKNFLLSRVLGAEVGKLTLVEPGVRAVNWNTVSIGSQCLIAESTQFLNSAQITIGNKTILGPHVRVVSRGHSIIDLSPNQKSVYIGDRVFVGAGSIILPGTQIGDDAVIGAGSVVVSSIPKGCVAVGNPAKQIKTIEGRDRDDIWSIFG